MRLRLMLIGGIFATVALILIEETAQVHLFGQVSLGISVYGIAVLTVVAVIAFPNLARKPLPVTLLMVVIGHGLWTIVYRRPLDISREMIYTAITELVLLGGALYLSRKISLSVHRLETSIHKAVFQLDSIPILSTPSGERAVTEELLRARQYEYPVSLICIYLDGLHKKSYALWTTDKELKRKYLFARAIQNLRGLIHESDLVFAHKDCLVLCISEISQAEASTLVRQLHDLFRVTHPEPVAIGAAGFPEEALVYEDLMALAHKRMTTKLELWRAANRENAHAYTEDVAWELGINNESTSK